MTRKPRLTRIVAIGVGLSLLACGGGDTRGGDSAASRRGIASDSAAADTGQRRIDYSAVVREARSEYRYGPPSPPIDATKPDELDDPDSASPNPTMEIATATPVAGGSPQYVIVARIVSNMDVPKLGILKDTNYVWVDRTNADKDKWDVYIIPQDSPLKPKKLTRRAAFTGGAHPGIHLVRAKKTRLLGEKLVDAFSFGVCTDDCPSGHCGYQ